MSRIKDAHRLAMSDIINQVNEEILNEEIMKAIGPVIRRRNAFPSLLMDFISYYLTNKMCLEYMKQQQANVKATLTYTVESYPFFTEKRSSQAATAWWLDWHFDHQKNIDEALQSIDADFDNAFDKEHATREHQCRAIQKYLQTLKIFEDTIKMFGQLVTVNTGAANRFGNNPKTPRSLQHASAKSLEAQTQQDLEELQSMTAMHYVLVKHGMSMSDLREAMQNKRYCTAETHADLQNFQTIIRMNWLYPERLLTLFRRLDEIMLRHGQLREIFIRLTIGDYEAMMEHEMFTHFVHSNSIYANLLRKNTSVAESRRCDICASMPSGASILSALLHDLNGLKVQ